MSDHEELSGLLGGDERGHYHLTSDELEWIRGHMYELYRPVIRRDQLLVLIADEEMSEYKVESDRTL